MDFYSLFHPGSFVSWKRAKNVTNYIWAITAYHSRPGFYRHRTVIKPAYEEGKKRITDNFLIKSIADFIV